MIYLSSKPLLWWKSLNKEKIVHIPTYFKLKLSKEIEEKLCHVNQKINCFIVSFYWKSLLEKWGFELRSRFLEEHFSHMNRVFTIPHLEICYIMTFFSKNWERIREKNVPVMAYLVYDMRKDLGFVPSMWQVTLPWI